MNTFKNLNEENYKLTIYMYVYLWYFSFNLAISSFNIKIFWEKWVFLPNRYSCGTVFFHTVFL